MAARPESAIVRDRRDHGSRNYRADSGNLDQASASRIGTCTILEPAIEFGDTCVGVADYGNQNTQELFHCHRQRSTFLDFNDREELVEAIPERRSHHSMFGKMTP